MRLFCAFGPGDANADLHDWAKQRDSVHSIARTYSNEVYSYCIESGTQLFGVSSHSRSATSTLGQLEVWNLPKPSYRSTLGYYWRENRYALTLILLAVRWRADAAIIDSGSMPSWAFVALRLAGIRVVPKLHNAFWAMNKRPEGIQRLVQKLTTGIPLRLASDCALVVSPECAQQWEALTKGKQKPLVFLPYFQMTQIPQRESRGLAGERFRVMYAGRMESNKGVLEVIHAAQLCQHLRPNVFQFDLYGEGSMLPHYQLIIAQHDLQACVYLHRQITARDLLLAFGRTDVLVMPTLESFPEALGKSMVEAALCGVPVIASAVVPATKLLPSSSVVLDRITAETLCESLDNLRQDPELYRRLSTGSAAEKAIFFDPNNSLSAKLKTLFTPSS